VYFFGPISQSALFSLGKVFPFSQNRMAHFLKRLICYPFPKPEGDFSNLFRLKKLRFCGGWKIPFQDHGSRGEDNKAFLRKQEAMLLCAGWGVPKGPPGTKHHR
jgi:hypothetical protein